MAHNPETRLRKLREIASKLEQGVSVAPRTLANWLGDDFQMIVDAWQEQLDLRADLKNKPMEVSEYEELLHRANFYNSRAEALEAKGSAAHGKFEDQALNYYAEALAQLQDSVRSNPGLQEWFDRDVFGSEDDVIHTAAGHMPLPVTSRSKENRGGGVRARWQTKTETKLEIVRHAISTLERELGVQSAEEDRQSGLRGWLANKSAT